MTEEERWKKYAHMGIAVMTLAAGIAFLISGRYLVRFGISDTGWTFVASLALFAMATMSIFALLTKKGLYGFISVLTGIFLLLLSAKALPLANRALQGTLHKYSLYAKSRLGADERIITYGINNPSIVFYSEHKIVKVGRGEELAALLSQGGRLFIISKAKEIEGLSKAGFHLLEEDGKYAILERQ
jgi:hypothetical protein